jgi:hypothetical protein
MQQITAMEMLLPLPKFANRSHCRNPDESTFLPEIHQRAVMVHNVDGSISLGKCAWSHWIHSAMRGRKRLSCVSNTKEWRSGLFWQLVPSAG